MATRNPNTPLGRRIDQVLEENDDLDQAGLARMAGVSKGTVTQWLDGKIKSLKFDYAVKIWRAKGYSPMWLILGEGPVRITEPTPFVAESRSAYQATWPFSVKREEFNRLPDDSRGLIDAYLRGVFDQWQLRQRAANKSA